MFWKALLANIIFLLLSQSGFAQINHNIISIQISDKLEKSEIAYVPAPMDYPFFDEGQKKIYYQVSLNSSKNIMPENFLFLEIKKKSNLQFKLKPLYQKKFSLTPNIINEFMDSVQVDSAQLVSGNYEFLLYFMADSNKIIELKKMAFQLMNTIPENQEKEEYYDLQASEKGQVVDVSKTFVAKYDMETLKRFILALKPISKGVEEKVLLSIVDIHDIKFLQQFFYNFWYNRNASNPESEWKKYTEKLNYVAKQYGAANLPGHQTDRGRIYLQYGEPDKIERAPSEKDAFPYEIWFYRTLENKSNISFLFYQPGMVGSQYFLLHSNFDKEVRNLYWMESLFTDPDNPDNKLIHRAYEFFK